MRYNYIDENLVSLHRLNHRISHAMYFWVQTILEGYIIEFDAENHQAFGNDKEICLDNFGFIEAT